MLMVSELLLLARGLEDGSSMQRRSPERFEHERPPVVVWNVCRHCNMTCPHCYAAATATPSPGDLDTAAGLALLRDLASAGVRVIIFSGGEPLLRSDLFELIAEARALGMSPQLSSNGVLIDREVALRLAALGVGYVGVSVDGLGEGNDVYRGLDGAYEKALAGLSHAREAGMRTGLRVTVSRRNDGVVPALLEVARERGIDRFYVSHLLYAGRGRGLMREDLDVTRTRELLLELFGLAESLVERESPLRVVTGGNDSAGPLLLGYVAERYDGAAAERVESVLRARGGNSAGESMVDIDHRGCVHPDQFWTQATLGDLRKQRFVEVLAHPLRAQLRQRISLLEGRCAQCRFLPLCRGSHRERALFATGRLWASDPACVMNEEEIRIRTME